MRSFVLMAAAALALGACATGQAGAPESYTSTRLDETHWRVEFSGDARQSQVDVEARLLRRAAELTVESGYEWFLPAGQGVDTESEVVVQAQRQATPSPVWRPMWRRHNRTYWSDWMVRGGEPPQAPAAASSQPAERLAAREDIGMGRGDPPAGAFIARDVLASAP